MLFLASIMLTSLLFLPAAAQMKPNHRVDIALDKPITNIVLPTIHGDISKFQDDFPEMSYGDYLVKEMGGRFIYSEGHWYLATSTKQKVAQISDQYMNLGVQDSEGGIPSFDVGPTGQASWDNIAPTMTPEEADIAFENIANGLAILWKKRQNNTGAAACSAVVCNSASDCTSALNHSYHC